MARSMPAGENTRKDKINLSYGGYADEENGRGRRAEQCLASIYGESLNM
jgi:hypothetical protein